MTLAAASPENQAPAATSRDTSADDARRNG